MRRRKFNYKKYLLLILVTIILFGGAYWVIKNNLFAVKKVVINLLNSNCVTEQIIQEKLPVLNKNIFLFGGSLNIDSLKDEYFCVRSVDVKRQLPDQITLDVNGRVAFANIFENKKIASTSAVASGSAVFATPSAVSKSFLLDPEAVIFAEEFKSDLPAVYLADQELILGKKIDLKTVQALTQIIDKLKELAIKTDQILVEQDTITVVYQPRLIFTTKRDIKNQVASLQLILEKAKIESKDLELIDVRFERPIIRYGKR